MYTQKDLDGVERTYKRWADVLDAFQKRKFSTAYNIMTKEPCYLCQLYLFCDDCILVREYSMIKRMHRSQYEQACGATRVFRTAYDGVCQHGRERYMQQPNIISTDKTVIAITRMLKLLNALSERMRNEIPRYCCL